MRTFSAITQLMISLRTRWSADTERKAKSIEDLKKDIGRCKEDLIRVDSLYRTLDIAKILEEASKTLRFCKCEGTFGRKEGPFRRCEQCGHMTCMTCGHNPTHIAEDSWRELLQLQLNDTRELPGMTPDSASSKQLKSNQQLFHDQLNGRR